MKEKNNFYITTAIFYVNARPHIGHIFEMIVADIFVRYHRLRGADTFFLTGTDEHGSKIVRSAQEHNVSPQEWVDTNAAHFKKAAEMAAVSYNKFIRTSDQEIHWPTAQEVWKRLEHSGDIYKKTYRGLYCVGHEAFITERDLVDGLCPEHGTSPEVVEEENYFFRLSRYTEPVRKLIESGELAITPEGRKNEILQLLREGLDDVSFSRPAETLLGWGVPVPGDETQLMYVWADALTNYLSGINYFSNEKTAGYWPVNLHVIGKEITRFHAAIWPAMLLSAGIPLPKRILAHGHITSGGRKMSKTIGNVIDPFDYIEEFGAEPLRYFLAAEIPTTDDGDFTRDRFVERYNADLASGLGNLASRITTLAAGVSFGKEHTPDKTEKSAEFTAAWNAYGAAFERFDLRSAAGEVWSLIHLLDHYIEQKKPWESKDEAVLYTLCAGLANISWMLRPFMPETAEKIAAALGIADKEKWGFEVKKILPLFPKINA